MQFKNKTDHVLHVFDIDLWWLNHDIPAVSSFDVYGFNTTAKLTIIIIVSHLISVCCCDAMVFITLFSNLVFRDEKVSAKVQW